MKFIFFYQITSHIFLITLFSNNMYSEMKLNIKVENFLTAFL